MRNDRHFTLIEILVALVLFAVFMPALVMTFRTGLNAYHRCEAYSDMAQDFYGVTLYLDQDFSRMIYLKENPVKASGTGISFFIYDPERVRAAEVRYFLESGGLIRETGNIGADKEKTVREKLAEGVVSAEFEFLIDSVWVRKIPEKKVPEEMRLTLNLNSDDFDRKFTHTVFMKKIQHRDKKDEKKSRI